MPTSSLAKQKLVAALMALVPGAQWTLRGDTLSDLEWLDTAIARPADAAINAQMAQPLPQNVVPQDLIAQFTTDDASKIQSAIASNVSFWGLWQALTAQGATPMLTTNARFKSGWSALVSVLGQERMSAIAAALGVTIP